ncbi:MAG: serine/threonine protein kinase [Anaerolineae bacterium]|nr:serine/threonine protein kinase [Anaerolineae bacterium]
MNTLPANNLTIGHRFVVADLQHALLGRGGMGEVYRGLDTQTGQPVAIKALRPEVAGSPGLLERFVREGEALRQLNHPNIVRLVEAVEENGQHYLIMEYVAGGSLRDLLDRPARFSPDLAGLPIEQTLAVALEVADALTRAHHLGITRRATRPQAEFRHAQCEL